MNGYFNKLYMLLDHRIDLAEYLTTEHKVTGFDSQHFHNLKFESGLESGPSSLMKTIG